MVHLILIRHGETEWNTQRRYQGHTDVPLNDVGRRQAALTAAHLAGRPIDAAYASDLKRAWETAAIIGEGLGLDVQPEPRLREIKFGVIEGLTFDEAQARYPDMIAAWIADRNQPLTGGETPGEFTARVQTIIDELQRKHQDQTVLLVTHGGPLKEILRLSLGLPPEGRMYFQTGNASLTELSLYDGRPVIRVANYEGHLNGVKS